MNSSKQQQKVSKSLPKPVIKKVFKKRHTGKWWRNPVQLTCGAVRRGELESTEAVREATLAVAWSWIGLEGGSDRAGLCPPSESLPWLLGGVGGKCRGSTAKWQDRQKITQGFKVSIYIATTATTTVSKTRNVC